MNIADINGTKSQSQSSALTEATSTNMGKEDFLRLLTVQLRNQDPLNPMENTDFIAQMAQFSSLEQLQNMNQSLEKSVGSGEQLQQAFRNNMATELVGRRVEIPTVSVDWQGEGTGKIGYHLGEGARSARLQITDGTGKLVREYSLDPSSARGSVEWDGRSQDGTEVPEGAYRVLVLAQDAAGDAVQASALKPVTVDAVRYDSRGATIWVDGQALSLDELSGVLKD